MSTLTHEGDDDEEVVFLPVTKHFLDPTILTSLSQQSLDFEEGPSSYWVTFGRSSPEKFVAFGFVTFHVVGCSLAVFKVVARVAKVYNQGMSCITLVYLFLSISIVHFPFSFLPSFLPSLIPWLIPFTHQVI